MSCNGIIDMLVTKSCNFFLIFHMKIMNCVSLKLAYGNDTNYVMLINELYIIRI